jgi:serine protease Do
MVLEALSRATDVSAALGELSREVARSVVLVRGSMGSAGSGVMWNQPKLLITNHHVVPGSSAEVVVAGGRRLGARVVRRAPALDLAALEVDGTLDAPVRVGDSDALRVGELVVALGNPMGERNAPSVGIVSLAPDDLLRLAMTLRPGNSGGALVNTRGEVVGIPHMVAGSGLALAVSSRVVGRFLSGFLGETEAELRWV